MNHKFDELTKSLVQSVTRRAALKKFGFRLAAMSLGTVLFAYLATAGSSVHPAQTSSLIPWSEIGAKAGMDYQGDGLTVSAAESGARLHCAFQRLDGEATREGLWLTSTVPGQPQDRFHVTAAAIGSTRLVQSGTVTVNEKTVRFSRPGLVEEYTVSMDGVRQDFLVLENPFAPLNAQPFDLRSAFDEAGSTHPTSGELRVQLVVTGARVEASDHGAQLVLENSGRKVAYSRLRVTDAAGKELSARMEVPDKSEIRNLKSDVFLTMVVKDADAVYPIRIDPTFSDANWISMGRFPGAPGAAVTAAVVDVSGNLYIGGFFNVVGDVVANYVAKWDGSSWSALGSGMNGDVYALAVSGGDLYAGGQFTTAGGVGANNIARWNGSSWSALGSGMNDNVLALAVSGSNLYAGGPFFMAGGVSARSIAKWNGSSWSALGSGLGSVPGSSFASSVSALAVSGSDLYAGGQFTTADESPANYIAKWNGSSWSVLGSGTDYPVRALAVSGNDLYAGGDFFRAGEVSARSVAKWNGSSWSALGSGMDDNVSALAVSGGDLYAGGYFTTAGGVSATNIAKWNGSSWSALGSGMGHINYPSVYALAVSGSDLYAGGYFTTAGGNAADSIAKWNGSSWSALGSGMGGDNASVSALAVIGGDLYAGGGFTTAGGVSANYVAKWNGSSWSALGSGMGGVSYPYVYALAVLGSNLYAGGDFTTADGVSATNIAKWNGSSWSALGAGMSDAPPPYSPSVWALAVSGSDLYAGGPFTTAGGSAANYIAKWNGSNWSALGSGMNNAVYALAVSGSDLYAGGRFTTAGGSPAKYIAKWNGSSWSALGSGMDWNVRALAVSGSDLYAGGDFTTLFGSPGNHIAKWNGSTWSPLGSGMDDSVWALAVLGSDLYAGGMFTTADGVPANYIAKWDGSNWSALGSGINGTVYALAVSGSDLYAGGRFETAGGKISAYVARAVLGDTPGYNQLTGTLISSGAMQFSYVGDPGTNYALDRTFNLTSPTSWAGQQTNNMTVSGMLKFTNAPATGTNNFWRVRAVP